VLRPPDDLVLQRFGQIAEGVAVAGHADNEVAVRRRVGLRLAEEVGRDHYETFRAQATSIRDGEGLPRFVEKEFRAFLRSGSLAGRLRALSL
jgi:hypothetical protein